MDVGCALGDGFQILSSACRSVTSFSGTDFSEYAISANKKNPNLTGIKFFSHDIMMPLPEKYDNIICLQTIEHVSKPDFAFKNLIDATRRILIVATPYMNRRPDENHLWSFDENDFAEYIDEYCLDKSQKNIYYLVNKTNERVCFNRGVFHMAINLNFLKKFL